MRQAAPEAAEPPPAADAVAPGPVEAPAPPPLSAGAAFLAAFWDFKDRYGLLILCLVGAAVYLYYNYWKPAQDRRTAMSLGEAAAEWEEKRRAAVERQQQALREGTAAFLKQQMEENERQQEKRKQRAQEEAKRLGMEHLTKKGQKLGHGPKQPTDPTSPTAAAEDWLS